MRVWRSGEVIVRREVWRGQPRMAVPVIVVQDEPHLLVTYIPEGAPFGFPKRDPTGRTHSYAGRSGWQGHGVLCLQRPDEAYAVMVFWKGERREFWGWYVNFQDPFRRTPIGFDTHDHEVDLWSEDGRTWHRKDFEKLEGRVARGIFTPAEAAAVLAEAERVEAELLAGKRWWDDSWMRWVPDESWPRPELPRGWERTLPSSVRVAAIIAEDAAVALIERQVERPGGRELYYLFPGGSVELDETPNQAVEREVLKELGLSVKAGRLLAEVSYRETIQYYFFAEILTGTFGTGVGDEINLPPTSAYGSYTPVWMPLEEILQKPVHPRAVAEMVVAATTQGWPSSPVQMTDPGR